MQVSFSAAQGLIRAVSVIECRSMFTYCRVSVEFIAFSGGLVSESCGARVDYCISVSDPCRVRGVL